MTKTVLTDERLATLQVSKLYSSSLSQQFIDLGYCWTGKIPEFR